MRYVMHYIRNKEPVGLVVVDAENADEAHRLAGAESRPGETVVLADDFPDRLPPVGERVDVE